MLKIVKASDPVTIDRINMCIYAAPGLGKTSLGFTADSPLNLDFDRGTHRSGNRKDTVQIGKWADVTSITPDDFAPYKTVVVDTCGRALDSLTQDIISGNPKMGRGGALTLQGYGELKSKFAGWLKMLNAFGKDVILLAHMDEQRNGDETLERLDIQGGSKAEVYKSVDAMGRIVVRGTLRYLDFTPHENSFGKNPCSLELIPFLDPKTVPDTLAKVLSTIKERINLLSADQVAAQNEIEDWVVALQDFETADDFNRCLDDIKKASRPVQSMAAKKARDLGLVFNQSEKLYEAPERVHA